jgi:hypothetical protein
MRFVDASVKLLGVASLAFGAWGLIHPRSVAALLGDDPRLGRQLGARDTAVGLALLYRVAAPLPLCLRFASDVHDALRLRERSPLIALGAAATAGWGAATLAGALLADRRRAAPTRLPASPSV